MQSFHKGTQRNKKDQSERQAVVQSVTQVDSDDSSPDCSFLPQRQVESLDSCSYYCCISNTQAMQVVLLMLNEYSLNAILAKLAWGKGSPPKTA